MGPIHVGMAELKVGKNGEVFTCVGLGSCIGVVLYDVFKKIGAIAHVMLPSIDSSRDKTNPAKCADTAIEKMIGDMERHGSRRNDIVAKMFGGADMFPNMKSRTLSNVGERNALAVRKELEKRGIRITAEDVGGNFGRTIVFDTKDGHVLVKNIKGEERRY